MFILLRPGRAILIILIFNDFLSLLRWKECRSRCSTSWQWLGWLASCWCFCQISFEKKMFNDPHICFFFKYRFDKSLRSFFLSGTQPLLFSWVFCWIQKGLWKTSSGSEKLMTSLKKASEVSEKNTWKAWTFTENYDSLILVSSVFFCSWNGTPLDEGPCHSSPRTSSQVFSALTNPPWKGLKMTMGSGVAPSLIFTLKKVELFVWKLYEDIATVHSQHLDDSPTYFLLKKWFNLLQKIPKMKFRHFNLLHSLHQLLRIWCAVYIKHLFWRLDELLERRKDSRERCHAAMFPTGWVDPLWKMPFFLVKDGSP